MTAAGRAGLLAALAGLLAPMENEAQLATVDECEGLQSGFRVDLSNTEAVRVLRPLAG